MNRHKNQMGTIELESDVFVQVAWELGDKIFRKHKRNILQRRFYLFSDWAILNSYSILSYVNVANAKLLHHKVLMICESS